MFRYMETGIRPNKFGRCNGLVYGDTSFGKQLFRVLKIQLSNSLEVPLHFLEQLARNMTFHLCEILHILDKLSLLESDVVGGEGLIEDFRIPWPLKQPRSSQ